ncbi:MAG: ArsR family transcriptional regulator, partial [Halobacteriales archaeon]|nr:ArsR family transcriptional regulator [Halobacteriales archaeon]
TIVLSYALPDGADETIDEIVDDIEPDVNELISHLDSVYSEELGRIASEMAPCRHCRTQKYDTYLLLTILRRAFVRAYV